MYSLFYIGYFWIETENIILELDFEVNHAYSTCSDSKSDYFQGTVYLVTPEFMSKFI